MKVYQKHEDILKNTIYSKKLSIQAKNFVNGREQYINLGVNEQCKLLCEAIYLFQCNSVISDLRLIGGSKHAGKLLLSKVLSKNGNAKNEVSIVNPSPTGLFEIEVNILKI